MRSCREDGLLLQPEKPPTAIDAQYDGRPTPKGGLAAAGGAQVWSTYSEVPLQGKDISAVMHHLLSIDVEGPYWIDTARDFFPGYDNNTEESVYLWDHTLQYCANGSRAIASGCVLSKLPALDDGRRPKQQHTDSHHWSLLHAAPVLPNRWIFLGELAKWVPTSSKRFNILDGSSSPRGVRVGLTCVHSANGSAEHIELTALRPIGSVDVDGQDEWLIQTVDVVCPSSGEASVCIGSC